MSEPAKLLEPQTIGLVSGLSNKKKVLVELSEMLAPLAGMSCSLILDGLKTREKLGSTCIGEGVAIPHCRMAISEPKLVVLKLDEPIEFCKGRAPVDVYFALLVPVDEHDEHLRLLSSIASLARQEGWLDSFRELDSEDAIKALVDDSSSALGQLL